MTDLSNLAHLDQLQHTPTGAFDGGAAFADGELVPLGEAKVSLFDWGFTRIGRHLRRGQRLAGRVLPAGRPHCPLRGQFWPSCGCRCRSAPPSCGRSCMPAVRAGGLQDAYVAMVCTRGVPPRGARDPRLAQNRFYAYALPYVWIAPPDKQRAGIDLHISQRQRIAPASVDPTVKNYHWLDLVQALFDGYDQGRDTSCVVDALGHITEGPGFNIFMVNGGTVSTPDSGVLEGISRRTVIELCARLSLPLQQRRIPQAELRAADEVFLSSTGGGVLPIARIDGQPLRLAQPGPVTARLQKAYWDAHADAAWRDPVDYGAAT